MARAFCKAASVAVVSGCAPPSTRRAILSVSSSVATAFRRHPSYARRRRCPADLELVCLQVPSDLLRLPARAGKYVIWMLGVQLDSCVWEFTERCLDWYNVFATRSDFLYASLDLGDHRLCDDAHGALYCVELFQAAPRHRLDVGVVGVGLSDSPQPDGRILPPGPRGPPGYL